MSLTSRPGGLDELRVVGGGHRQRAARRSACSGSGGTRRGCRRDAATRATAAPGTRPCRGARVSRARRAPGSRPRSGAATPGAPRPSTGSPGGAGRRCAASNRWWCGPPCRWSPTSRRRAPQSQISRALSSARDSSSACPTAESFTDISALAARPSSARRCASEQYASTAARAVDRVAACPRRGDRATPAAPGRSGPGSPRARPRWSRRRRSGGPRRGSPGPTVTARLI